jgi:hypothetical protein
MILNYGIRKIIKDSDDNKKLWDEINYVILLVYFNYQFKIKYCKQWNSKILSCLYIEANAGLLIQYQIALDVIVHY